MLRTLLFGLTLSLIVAIPALSAPSRVISYQGYLKDGAGKPVTAPTNLTFRLYSSTSGVNPVWTESRSVTPANGVYSVGLGEVTPLAIPFTHQYYLGIQAGSAPELLPLQMLMAVPYALSSGCNPGDMLNCYTGLPGTMNSGLCKSGVRTCPPDGSGFGVCEGEVTPNCGSSCLDLAANVDNCGSCGNACVRVANASPGCSGGVCGYTCTNQYGDCDRLPANGCETNLSNNISNCGACGNRCVYANGFGSCSGGACLLTYCSTGYGNCDNNSNTGCETSLMNSTDNCGACGRVCSLANALNYCQGGTCGISYCLTGYGNCDGIVTTGCETSLMNSATNCGACGNVCALANTASHYCQGGICGVTLCTSGYGNCDGVAVNGCETNLSTNRANCGACGTLCPSPANATSTCTSGVCGFICTSGYGNCDGVATNGCEVNLATSLANCGACRVACPSPANATATCSGGVCGFTCTSGYGNCNGIANDGCETSLSATTANCGACGTVCPARANATTNCSGGVCGFICNSGFRNCNGLAADGCETYVMTSPLNCGACGQTCPSGSPCVNGTCIPL